MYVTKVLFKHRLTLNEAPQKTLVMSREKSMLWINGIHKQCVKPRRVLLKNTENISVVNNGCTKCTPLGDRKKHR